jgi:hypothetical protein
MFDQAALNAVPSADHSRRLASIAVAEIASTD